MQTIHLKEGFIYLWSLTFKLNYHFVLKKSYNNDDKIASNFKEIIETWAMQRRFFTCRIFRTLLFLNKLYLICYYDILHGWFLLVTLVIYTYELALDCLQFYL